MKAKWCEHIQWQKYWRKWEVEVGGVDLWVPDSWVCCPQCRALRPTKENIRAAKLRTEMDTDL